MRKKSLLAGLVGTSEAQLAATLQRAGAKHITEFVTRLASETRSPELRARAGRFSQSLGTPVGSTPLVSSRP